MKKIILILGLTMAVFFAQAQKVALHAASGVQHFIGVSALINAYNASVSGDTIYLPGGGFTAPNLIDKQLYIFGAGHYPDSTLVTAKTFILGTLTLSDNADGFRLEGVEINGSLYFENNTSVDNVQIKYCAMQQLQVQGNLTIPCNNITVSNCVIKGVLGFNNAQNSAVYNSIMEERVNSDGNLFENNIFLLNTSGTTGYVVNGNNNVCNNGIFFNPGNRYFAGNSNQINNTLFVVSPALGGTPIAANNYFPIAQNSIFVNHSGYNFDYIYNYHLQAPGTYLGIDGSEVGLYGGTFGYKEGAVPSNPHLRFQNISPTTNANGFLNVEIKAAAQDN